MDYTNHPENNLLPGRANFLRLQEMYGLPNQRPLGPHDDQPIIPNMFDPNNRPQMEEEKPSKEDKPKKEKDDRKGHHLWSRMMVESSHNSDLPSRLAQEYKKAMAELEHHIQKDSSDRVRGWRRLKEDSHGVEFVRRLGEDYHIKVQMLYASPRN